MKLGDVIKTYRTKHDLSMEQFGHLAGISKMSVSVFERNFNSKTGKEPSASRKTLVGCANAMGLSLEELIAMLDDDQLINVVYQQPLSRYSRTLDLDKRVEYFVDELSNRSEPFCINDIELSQEDIAFLKTNIETTWEYLKTIIISKHEQK